MRRENQRLDQRIRVDDKRKKPRDLNIPSLERGRGRSAGYTTRPRSFPSRLIRCTCNFCTWNLPTLLPYDMTRSMVAQSQYYRATRSSDYSFGRATRVKDRRSPRVDLARCLRMRRGGWCVRRHVAFARVSGPFYREFRAAFRVHPRLKRSFLRGLIEFNGWSFFKNNFVKEALSLIILDLIRGIYRR